MTILDYIRGDRRGKEAHRLERQAMGDPFLTEALEGFDAVAGPHDPAIERLRRRLASRAGGPRRRVRLARWGAAAAVALIFVALGGVLWRRPGPVSVEASAPPVLAETAETAETVPIPPAEDSAAGLSGEIAMAMEPPVPAARRQAAKPVVSSEIIGESADEVAAPTPDTDAARQELSEAVRQAPVATRAAFSLDAAPPRAKTDIRSRAAADSSIASFGVTEVAPSAPGFPVGGLEAYRAYLRAHMIRPAGEVTGRVLLEFRVDRRGRPAGIRVVEGLGPEADREARRLVEAGPDWVPGEGRVRVAIEF